MEVEPKNFSEDDTCRDIGILSPRKTAAITGL